MTGRERKEGPRAKREMREVRATDRKGEDRGGDILFCPSG
jgi:hypothetical protein